jgi:hypothetical protein
MQYDSSNNFLFLNEEKKKRVSFIVIGCSHIKFVLDRVESVFD